MDDRFFVVGTITLNRSRKSYKVELDSGYDSGIVSRKDLLLLSEGKINCAEIVVFKNFLCMQQLKRSEQRILVMKNADPDKLSLPLEP